jgi:hypothetical protein
MSWLPLLSLAVILVLLVLLEHWIHRHLQGAMLLLSGDRELSVMLYALPLLPGIVLHEISHALTAKLLGVRVGRISIRPQMEDQRIQLGFVPVEKTDVLRASLIGLAPLLTGSLIIMLIGFSIFDVDTIQQALVETDLPAIGAGLREMLKVPDFWLWAYVVFTVGNTMFPSRSDRQTWTPVALFLLLIGLLLWLVGAWPVIAGSLAESFTAAIRWLVVVYAFTVAMDLPFILSIMLLEKCLERVKGMEVAY